MHIFGCKFSLKTETGDTVPDRKNFDSLLWAIVTVFQVTSLHLVHTNTNTLNQWRHSDVTLCDCDKSVIQRDINSLG